MNSINFEEIAKKEIDNPYEFEKNHFLLPQHFFRMIVVGSSGSGKTNTVLNMLINPKSDMTIKWDKLYLYAKDIQEPKYEYLIKALNTITKEMTEKGELTEDETIFEVGDKLKDIVSYEDLDPSIRNVIIIDDMINETNLEKSNVMNLFTMGRKKSASVIFISQNYTKIPKIIRHNCGYIIVHKLNGLRNIKNIAYDCGEDLNQNEFVELYNEIMKENPYNFLFIDKISSDIRMRYRNGFNKLLTKKIA